MLKHWYATSSDELAADLVEARDRTLRLISDLTEEQLMGPRLAIVNPFRWEVGHLGWFMERWLLRREGQPSVRADADSLYDSFRVPHDSRWDLPLPSTPETLAYLEKVLNQVLERLPGREPDQDSVYFHRMVAFHEDMHVEAFTYTRQTLGYPAPPFLKPAAPPTADSQEDCPGDVEIRGGRFRLGAETNASFVHDNEKWAHAVQVAPFRMARGAVTQREYRTFVEEGGYGRSEFWSRAGWEWRVRESASAPVYWKQDSGDWYRRHFDGWIPLEAHLPMLHVNQFEAEAFCRWAGRRLPTETEWEMAASWDPAADDAAKGIQKRHFPWGESSPGPERANLDFQYCGCLPVGDFPEGDSAAGCRQMIGNSWEWTSSDLLPYPGFVVDPYREYSEPFFGNTVVLRGGSWATRGRMIRNTWRNFQTPDRRDLFAGFRTCAL